MNPLPHLASRLYGMPLLIHRPKLDTILSVLGSRVEWPVANALATPDFQPKARDPTPGTDSGIAVIPVYGTLVRRTVGLEAASGLTSYTALAQQLSAAVADPAVRGIVLDIDSPGGEAGGVFDLADQIRAACKVKPVWAVANDMAFSAAYALAAAAQRVVLPRTGGVGSVGVIALHVDQSVKDARDGLHYRAITAGAHKNDLSPHAPLSGDAEATLQTEVNRLYDLFAQSVALHRNLTVDTVKATEAGLFFGGDAIQVGLADAVGTLDEAVAELSRWVSGTGPPARQAISPRPQQADLSTATGASRDIPAAPVFTSETHLLKIAMSDQNPTIPPAPSQASAALTPAAAAASDVPSAATAASTQAASSVLPPIPVAAAAAPTANASNAALEIAQLCQLAGRTDLIAGFLSTSATVPQVRSQLLAAQAGSSAEISSHIAPAASSAAGSAPTSGASASAVALTGPNNPVVQAALVRAGRPASAFAHLPSMSGAFHA
ncbi:S49 family peptidase [Ottowia testudinis]|uniref:S49 family peptidase n=1 Tax=Ottowia testudinis TaxID=2816950 RepID=A0A975CGC2_9BURK|nr:S49 family peptidase [Ottowia testudinis]QTD44377.1 S49 family peptidase [Ottowia testudinis]